MTARRDDHRRLKRTEDRTVWDGITQVSTGWKDKTRWRWTEKCFLIVTVMMVC